MDSVNFDRGADVYDATRGFPDGVAEQVGEFIAQNANLSKTDRVLEIGIGTGRIALPLAPHVDFVAGADISIEMMKVLLNKRRNESVFPLLADAHDLPYASDSFDAVLIVHVLHLVSDPVKILRDVQRVLKPGGQLLHCFNDRSGGYINPVVKAWNDNRPKRKRGYNWRQTGDAIKETGWTQHEEVTYTYSYSETPQTLLDAVKTRAWSSLWDTSDADIAPAINAITEAVKEHYNGDFQAEMQRQSGFTMQILRAPA